MFPWSNSIQVFIVTCSSWCLQSYILDWLKMLNCFTILVLMIMLGYGSGIMSSCYTCLSKRCQQLPEGYSLKYIRWWMNLSKKYAACNLDVIAIVLKVTLLLEVHWKRLLESFKSTNIYIYIYIYILIETALILV